MTTSPLKIFVAGATGVLGRRVVARLVAAGHEVTGVARTPEKAAGLRSGGATPAMIDLFDAATVKDAVVGHDVVVNLATHIPPTSRAALPGAWSENDRIRTEGARNLVDAALAAGAGRYIQESIAFIYGDGGDSWLDEDAPLVPAAYVRSVLDAEANATRFSASGGAGVVLRFGLFHGPDSGTSREAVSLARRGIAATLGAAEAYEAIITIDDAAAAVVAALNAPAGVYNVVDDQPLTRREYADALAAAVGRTSLRLPPRFATKLGGSKVALLGRSQRVSNRRFVEATRWRPSFASAREAWPMIVAEIDRTASPLPRLSMFCRIALAWVAGGYALVGGWASIAPRSFFSSFPGAGHHWVSVDGPFNEHLVRDFGALNLAVTLVLVVAAWKGGRTMVRTAAAAAIVWGAPHLAYHVANVGVLGSTVDQAANLISLATSLVLPAAVLMIARNWPASPAEANRTGAMVG